MNKVACHFLILVSGLALVLSPAHAKKNGMGLRDLFIATESPDTYPASNTSTVTSAAVTTLMIASYKFDSGGTCTAQGWTTVDLTAQTGDYWHVDDFAGLGGSSIGGITFSPIQGTKSMWMGKRPPSAGPVDLVHCGYLALPGYGNSWTQSFCSKDCLPVAGGPTPDLDIAFKLKFDGEPSYDYTALEVTNDCSGNTGWEEIDGGNPEWTGAQDIRVTGPYTGLSGNVRVRLLFASDGAFSNQDNLYPGLGAMVDSLSWETTAVEDFEGEAIDAHTSNDWTSCNTPGFGNYLALFKRSTGANYEDPCVDNLSCYWAAINGSTEFYTCGVPAQPTQRIVPHVNERGQYLANEIWSPVIPFPAGSGSDYRLVMTFYWDLPLENLVGVLYGVRTINGTGCPGPWRKSGPWVNGDKAWSVTDWRMGQMLDLNAGVSMQATVGVVDMAQWWMGIYGTGACHSPAPYIDTVKIKRIDVVGPQWSGLSPFQDTFATDGTTTGTARADAFFDTRPRTSPTITPGDSVGAFVVDPKTMGTGLNASGLSNDPNVSTFIGRHKTKKAVYLYVAVWPLGQPGKVGDPLSEGPGGQANRYPHIPEKDMVIDGVPWTCIRMDYTYWGSATTPGLGTSGQQLLEGFNVDLNDNLFTPGDTICYFVGATSPEGTNYFSGNWGRTASINEVAANPMEFTILPAGGWRRGGDILYVDGADGWGVQPYFDGAFQALGLSDKVDRYDVVVPGNINQNRLGSRVYDVAAQLNACYRTIIWDCGTLPVTLGDGSGSPFKTDDYALLNTFLANLENPGGVYLAGDDVADNLNGFAGASAINFRSTYLPFTLVSGSHRDAPTNYVVSPKIVHWPGRAYTDDFVIFGGCPRLNNFDVMRAAGSSQVELSYNTSQNMNGAVLSNANGNARVVLSGFSLMYMRDDELDGISDRAQFLRDTIVFLGGGLGQVTDAGPVLKNELSQNYPNPFNPQTTIAFSIMERGAVSLKIYNVAGELVRTLIDEPQDKGPHTKTWDGRDNAGQGVASGVYFYKLATNNFSQTRKMVLLK